MENVSTWKISQANYTLGTKFQRVHTLEFVYANYPHSAVYFFSARNKTVFVFLIPNLRYRSTKKKSGLLSIQNMTLEICEAAKNVFRQVKNFARDLRVNNEQLVGFLVHHSIQLFRSVEAIQITKDSYVCGVAFHTYHVACC